MPSPDLRTPSPDPRTPSPDPRMPSPDRRGPSPGLATDTGSWRWTRARRSGPPTGFGRAVPLYSAPASNAGNTIEIAIEADDLVDAFAKRDLDEDGICQIETTVSCR